MKRLRRRLRYRFDNVLSRGTWAVLLWLGAATVVTLLLSTMLLWIFDVELGGSQNDSWFEDFWQSTMRILDPGTMAGDVGWGRRLLALLVTLFGILIAGTLIGIIAAGVENRLEAMQRGRSAVVESDHVVILGASPRLSVVVEQLALSGRTRRRNVIVILANREPSELSHEIRDATTNLYGARLVFRWGDPTSVSDLDIVAPRDARAVIVLADDEVGDSDVVKAVLAMGAALGSFETVPIIAEVDDPHVARSLVHACGSAVHPIIPDQAIARIAAYALRGPGLIQVIRELLDFNGPDLYVRNLPEFAGRTFGDVVLGFDDATPIGVMSDDGAVELSPDPDVVLGSSTRLVYIAEDDGPITAPERTASSVSALVSTVFGGDRPVIREQHLQHVLIVGWNSLARQLVEQFDRDAAPGSTVNIVYDPGLLDDAPDAALCSRVELTLTSSSSRTLQLDNEHHRPESLTSILLLAYRHRLTSAEADSRTLLNLRVVRRELADRTLAPNVVVELRDAGNVDLAPAGSVDDFVISDAIASEMIAQLAELPERRAVLLQLYTGTGPGIGAIDPSILGVTGAVAFSEVARSAYGQGLIAIGWSRSAERGNALTLCPHADARIELEPGDRIVVIG